MTNMNEKKKAGNKWANRAVMVLLMCFLIVLIITSIHTCKAYGEENPTVNLVLQFDTADGGILKGLIAHYLKEDHSIRIRDGAKYTVIILDHKKSVYFGLLDGSHDLMFVSGIILSEATTPSGWSTRKRNNVLGGFANMSRWNPDKNKRNLARTAATAIATLILIPHKGE